MSPSSGSALVTVAKALAQCQLAAGRDAALVVRAEVDHGEPGFPLVRVPMADKVWRTRSEKLLDLAAGATTGHSPTAAALWRPIVDAVAQRPGSDVFLHNSPAAVSAFRGSGSRPVAYLHNEVLRGWPRWRRTRLLREAPVVAVSRFIAVRGFGERAVDEGRVLPLLNGVDTDAFRPAAAEVEPTILFLGKVAEHKGPHLLIAAAKQLMARGHRFRVRIVGGAVLSASAGLTPYERALRAEAAELGDRIEFVPFTTRVALPDVYRAASIMVVPSDWDEPCALTLPEAMASGLACVSSTRGGLPEVGGDAVLLFDPTSPDGLTRHLASLLLDDSLRRELAASARERALATNWTRQFAKLSAWLESRGSP